MPREIRIEPMDALNQALINDAHPADWINPTPKGRYNLVVIGGGTAGLVSAAIAAGLGAKVALIERHLMGGDCLNFGCVPSKAILRCARAMAEVRGAAACGIEGTQQAQANFAAVMERMRRLRSGISPHDSARRFAELGVDVYLGSARFTGSSHVEVEGNRLEFAKAIIATGARAAVPPIEGLEGSGYLTNETVFSLQELPSSLAVLGAGPIGCELAQAFQRLGSRVTLIEAAERILPREEAGAAQVLHQVLAREGVQILVGTKLGRVHFEEGRRVLTLQSQNAEQSLTVRQLLVAIGRTPNVDGLGLESAGVAYDRQQGVRVNDALRTTNPRIYAAGDVCSAVKFTHLADFAARIAVQNALFPFLPRKRFSSLLVPGCVYTEPEIAQVGESEASLREFGIPHVTLRVPLSTVDRAILDGEMEGHLSVHADPKSGAILGATLVARHAGESIGELTLAMQHKIGLGALGSVIHPYPTQAEAIRKAADQFNRQRLTPGRKRVLQWILSKLR